MIVNGTQYAVVISCPTGIDSNHAITLLGSTLNAATNVTRWGTSLNNGVAWTVMVNTWQAYFQIWDIFNFPSGNITHKLISGGLI
jgi:hypothetical protein